MIKNKKKFARTMIITLACFVFLCLMGGLVSRADEPGPATARLIYASNLDDDGNPTETTEYSFDAAEGYSAFAVYVEQGEGSEFYSITLDPSVIDVDYTAIRIWDNDCQVTVNTDEGYVNGAALILTGDNSYLDVGLSHFRRGGCDAAVYDGDDTAAAIAEYFNAFISVDDDPENINYRNDESITLFYDAGNVETNEEDPHYNKTVYTIDWDMSVADLTLQDNVVAFIQGDEGMIRVAGSITIGDGSYIDAIDSAARLEILDDGVTLDGMSLYDYFGEAYGTPLTEGLAGEYFYTVQQISGAATSVFTKVIDISEAVGDSSVTAAAKKYIYAYANMDFDGDGDADGDDMSFALAAELIYKFKGAYGLFGLSDTDYNLPPEEVWGALLESRDAEILRTRIAINFESGVPINVKLADGTTTDIQCYEATVTWGYPWETPWGPRGDGELIQDIVYVYQLNSPEDILVCTNFDEITGTGEEGTFYVRDRYNDKMFLVGSPDTPPESIDEDLFASVIVTPSIGNVVVGGHGLSMYANNVDRNLLTFQTIGYLTMQFREEDEWHEVNTGTFIKVFNSDGYFFATTSEGEEKAYDFVSHDVTGNAAGKVWETNGENPVKLFIHDNILHIMPLNNNSGVAKALAEVRLADSLPASAVTIDNSNPDDIVITFNSNFYDTVDFELVYEDDTVGAFTVEREGIIIQYTGLDASGNGRYWLDIYGEGEGNEFNYTYDPETENFVVMATYYHSSAETGNTGLSLVVTYDDGGTEVISSTDEDHDFSGYKAGSSYGAVDTTTFIIGFAYSTESTLTFSKNGHTGGFSVQVVNSGYDASDSFGGAMAGSGKGKHWSGTVSLYN